MTGTIERLYSLVMITYVVTISTAIEEYCPGTVTIFRDLPQLQNIVIGSERVEYTFSVEVASPQWCINGWSPDDIVKVKANFTIEDRTLVLHKPSDSDNIQWLTIYLVDKGNSESGLHCTYYSFDNLVSIQSNTSSVLVNATYIIINLVEADESFGRSPVNGGVVMKNNNGSRTFEHYCHHGYYLNGTKITRCEGSGSRGLWRTQSPTCIPIVCETMSLKNGRVEYLLCGTQPAENGENGVVPYETTATFYCDEGFNLSSNSNCTCSLANSSGEWSGEIPTCQAITTTTDNTSLTTSTTPTITMSTSAPLSITTTTDNTILITSTTPTPTMTMSTSTPSFTAAPIIITDPEGISIVFIAFIVGLVLGVLAASVVCYVCVKIKRAPPTRDPTMVTGMVEINQDWK